MYLVQEVCLKQRCNLKSLNKDYVTEHLNPRATLTSGDMYSVPEQSL